MSEVTIWAVLSDVAAERRGQDARWGEQNHPDVYPVAPEVIRSLYRRKADDWKVSNAKRVDRGVLSWDGILLEEVYEALTESDPVRLREELIQVAAVAACWAEAIDRRDCDG